MKTYSQPIDWSRQTHSNNLANLNKNFNRHTADIKLVRCQNEDFNKHKKILFWNWNQLQFGSSGVGNWHRNLIGYVFSWNYHSCAWFWTLWYEAHEVVNCSRNAFNSAKKICMIWDDLHWTLIHYVSWNFLMGYSPHVNKITIFGHLCSGMNSSYGPQGVYREYYTRPMNDAGK